MAEAQRVSLTHAVRALPSDVRDTHRYDFAEQCANRALNLDPQFTKARFRRGQARKGSLQLAAAGIGALTCATPF